MDSWHHRTSDYLNASYRDQPLAIIWHFQRIPDRPAELASP
jgi:hypothetical protein